MFVDDTRNLSDGAVCRQTIKLPEKILSCVLSQNGVYIAKNKLHKLPMTEETVSARLFSGCVDEPELFVLMLHVQYHAFWAQA